MQRGPARGPTLPPPGGATVARNSEPGCEKKREKKSRKERDRELRDDGFKKSSGVNYTFTASRHMDDMRFERAHRQKEREQQVDAIEARRLHLTAPLIRFVFCVVLLASCLTGRRG